MEVLKLFAPYGPGWLGGAALTLIAFYFGKQFLEEYKRQNERKGEIDLKREERKQDEVKERAQRGTHGAGRAVHRAGHQIKGHDRQYGSLDCHCSIGAVWRIDGHGRRYADRRVGMGYVHLRLRRRRAGSLCGL